MTESDGPRRALVLSGGGARGAYEAGVLRYILDTIPAETGESVDFDILAGTSVGAVNTAWMASALHAPQLCARRMWYLWRTLSFSEVVEPAYRTLLSRLRRFLGVGASGRGEGVEDGVRGGFVKSRFFRELIGREIDFDQITRNLTEGLLDAVTVTATDIASGRTTVFAETASGELPPWTRDPRRVAAGGELTADKVLASAAIPMLFPPVQIGDRWFADGGLRQNTPLTPALRLGADRVLVINLHSETMLPEPATDPFDAEEGAHAFEDQPPSFGFQLGKLLDALLLDPLEYDLMVLERINAILEHTEEMLAGGGESGKERLNQTMRAHRGQEYRVVETELLRPSRDLGQMAYEFAQSVDSSFWGSHLVRAVCERAGADEGYGEADLLSYLLFDGGYTGELLDLGYRDAEAEHDELVAFFED